MSGQRYDIVDAVEDACKEVYNFGLFGLKAFYKVTNMEALKTSYDEYALSRFSQTVEIFQHEHENIDWERRKEFYEDLKYNEQNLAYLYSMFEKSRSSTFLIHMKILAKLSSSLIENKTLNYFESSLLANINLLNEDDFIIYKKVIKNYINEQDTITYITEKYEEIISLNKFQNIGILSQDGDLTAMGNNENKYGMIFRLNKYSQEFYDTLVEILGE